MSREVDERIVEMQFDNRQFERGVSQTISSLDRLTDALRFEGVGDSVRGIQNGINRLDFSPISNGVSALEGTLTSLTGRIKLEVFDRLANYAVDTGEKVLNALTLKGARAGFAEYETQQGAVQTILANTQHLGTTITDVNKALNDLNDYADLTIYNFTEMTRNIGTFTAAGLDLETSTSAIKGIANLAAVSGSTSEQASRAMYQLSQALASGTVNLQDWNSVVNAGMGGKVFQDALKRTAKHMGIVVDETQSFRESISTKNGNGWLTTDVLSETLKQFSGDLDEAALAAQGWSAAEIKEITTMAKTATDAATVVKTFSQLMDTVSEQIGSGWTRTWQLIFGDFEESKKLWTSVYKAISPYIDAISDLRNGYLQFWKENEGREKVIQAFSNLWSGASNFIDKFTDAFKDAFPVFNNFGQVLVNASDRFLAFSERFKVVKDKADQLTTSFDKVSTAISKITAEDKKNALDIWNWGNIKGRSGRIDGQDRVEALGESYDAVQTYINTFIESGYDVAKTDALLGVGADNVTESLTATAKAAEKAMTTEDKLAITLHNLTRAFASIVDVAKVIGGSVINVIKAAGSAFGDVFDAMTVSSDISGIAGVLSKVAHAFEITAEKAEDVKRIFRGVFAAFDIVYRLVRAVAIAIGSLLTPSLSGVGKASGGLLKLLGNFGDWIYALDQAIREGDIFNIAIEKMIGFVGTLDDKIIGVVHSFEKWSGIDFGKITSKITKAIANGLAILKDWTGIDIASIFKSLWEHIKTFLGLLKAGDFKGAFSYVVDGLKNFAATVVDVVKSFSLKDILTKAGSMFGNIGEWFRDIFDSENLSKMANSSGNILLKVFGGIALALKSALDLVLSIVNGPAAKKLGNSIKELFTNLFAKPTEDAAEEKSGMEKLKEFLVGLGSALAAFYQEVKPIVSAGFSGAFLKSLLDIAAALKNFSEAPKNFTKALMELAQGFDTMTKSFHVETMTRFVNALGNALIKLVIAIAAIMILDKMGDGVHGAVVVITFMLAEIVGALTFAQKKLDTKLDMVFLIKMITAIGNLMLKLAISLAVIGMIGDGVKIGSTLVAFNNIMLDLGIMLTIMSKIVSSKQFRRGGEGLVMLVALMDQLGKTVMKMSVAMVILSIIDPKRMGSAITGLGSIFLSLAGILTVITLLAKNLGDDKKDELAAIGGVFSAIASAFLLIVPAVAMLALIPPDNIKTATLAVAGLGLIMTGMMVALEQMSKGGTNSKAIAAAGMAMLGVATAITMLVPGLVALSMLNPKNLFIAIGAMATIMAAMAGLVAILSLLGGGNIALAGLGILALATAFTIAIPPITMFAAVVVPLLEKAFKKVEKTSNKKLAKIALVILGFSAALAVAAVALAAFGLALIPLALTLPLIIVPLTLFITALKPFVKSLGAMAAAVKEAAPTIADALLAVLKAILDAILGSIPVIVESLLSTLDAIVTSLIDHAPSILLGLGILITMVLKWLDDNVATWTASIVSIILKIIIGVIYGLADRIGDILKAVMYFLGALIRGIFAMFASLFDGLFGGGKKWTAWWEEHGGNFIDGFVDCWQTGVDTIKKFFMEDLPKWFAERWQDFKDMGAAIMTAIGEGIAEAVPWGKAGMSFGDWLAGDANEIADSIPTVDYQELLNKKKAEKAIKDGSKGVNKEMEKAGNNADKSFKKGLGEHSPSVFAADAMSLYFQGAENGLNASEPNMQDLMAQSGMNMNTSFEDGLGGTDWGALFNGKVDEIDFDEMQKSMNENMSGTVSPDITVEPNVKMDVDDVMRRMDPRERLKDAIMAKQQGGTGFDLSSSLNLTTTMSQESADMEKQRHDDTEDNTKKVEALTEAITSLTSKWKGGIINIPENATFTVPVDVDGETIANVTAPYLDVINANNVNYANKGVTTR